MDVDANETQPDSGAAKKRKHSPKPKKVRGFLRLKTLNSLDGRTRARVLADDLYDKLMAERGGADTLDVRKRKHCETWAVLTLMIENQMALYLTGEEIDPKVIATLINSRQREGEVIGQPEPKDATPTIDAFVASLERQKAPASEDVA
jgi:hypothetical protein